jgi:hypothetical protein
MRKNYPDQLGAWVRQRKASARDRNLVAFLAVRDDVRAALDAGYPVKTIWSNLHEANRIKVSYTAFLRYVKKLVIRSPSEQTAPESQLPPARSGTKPDKPASFIFNPIPKKEELL